MPQDIFIGSNHLLNLLSTTCITQVAFVVVLIVDGSVEEMFVAAAAVVLRCVLASL